MVKPDSNRFRRRALGVLASVLAVAALVWWQRTEVTRLAVERVLAGGPVAVQRIAGLDLERGRARLAALEFTVDTPLGQWAVTTEDVVAEYRLGDAELAAVAVQRAKIRLRHRAGGAPADQPDERTPAGFPLRHLRVESLDFAADGPGGGGRFSGTGELLRAEDGGVALIFDDDTQTIRVAFSPDFASATLRIMRKPQALVAEVQVQGMDGAKRHGQLQAAAPALIEWLSASPLVPDRLREELVRRGWNRLAAGLTGFAVKAAAESSDGFRSLHGSGGLWKDDRVPVRISAAIDASGAVDCEGQMDEAAAALLEVARPLLPEVAKTLKIASGRLKGGARLRREPDGRLTATAQLELAGLAMEAGALRIEGARAELRSDDPFGPSAVVKVNAPRLGFGADVDAGELVLEASLLGRELKVEKAAVQVFGGALELEPSRLDFAERPIPLIVRIRDVDLAQALAALSQPGLSGGGTVSGVLPFRWMSDSIELEGGELTGAGPGVFRYRGPAADDSLAFRALRNFLYRQLQARLDYRPSGDYRLGVRLEGHNPDVLAGHPIAFKLNVSGRLPELLRQGILAGDFERPVLEMYQNAQTEPKPGRAGGPRKPPPADRRNR